MDKPETQKKSELMEIGMEIDLSDQGEGHFFQGSKGDSQSCPGIFKITEMLSPLEATGECTTSECGVTVVIHE